ncbi:MAG: polymer-forming cytoskeletal protein [Pseudomonadota bacterium]
MFSKTRASDAVPQPTTNTDDISPKSAPPTPESKASGTPTPAAPQPSPKKTKPAASVLSSDITITGNVLSSGDIQIEGAIDGDVRAHTLIVGETATVKGEIVADEVIVHGRVGGRLRGLKVRLSSTARVDGDIVHKAIAIESGAQFEGSVQRQEDPIGQGQRVQPTGGLTSVPTPPQPKAAAAG